MTDTPAPESAGYVPFDLEFDKLAADIRAFSGEDVLPEMLHGLVDDALRHVRDETSPIANQSVGLVLMTAAVLVQTLENAYSGWNGRMIANLLATLGQRLWDDADTSPSGLTPHPDGVASKWWAVWELDNRLRAIEEFTTPQTRDEVLATLHAQGDFRPCELVPLTDAWAKRLRYLFELGRGARAEEPHTQITPERAS